MYNTYCVIDACTALSIHIDSNSYTLSVLRTELSNEAWSKVFSLNKYFLVMYPLWSILKKCQRKQHGNCWNIIGNWVLCSSRFDWVVLNWLQLLWGRHDPEGYCNVHFLIIPDSMHIQTKQKSIPLNLEYMNVYVLTGTDRACYMCSHYNNIPPLFLYTAS